MEKNYQVQEEIKRTLQSLEGLKPAEPAPFSTPVCKRGWRKKRE